MLFFKILFDYLDWFRLLFSQIWIHPPQLLYWGHYFSPSSDRCSPSHFHRRHRTNHRLIAQKRPSRSGLSVCDQPVGPHLCLMEWPIWGVLELGGPGSAIKCKVQRFWPGQSGGRCLRRAYWNLLLLND